MSCSIRWIVSLLLFLPLAAPVVARPERLDDQALLDLVQERTFRYFLDRAHPVSGMAPERNTTPNVVTTGGTGFGVMALVAGIDRGFLARDPGVSLIGKIVSFLKRADRFHGVYPHWLDGTTGKVIPFSPKDDGGDIVETAFLMEGLLAARQYLDPAHPVEGPLVTSITRLFQDVEWDWHTRGGRKVLYWHWSPDNGWAMNHPIHGWNECLIAYVLAASSPTHAIEPDVYHKGFARDGEMKNGRTYEGLVLPLGEPYGGPLFFAHYSFLGLDPRGLQDRYTDYWRQNVNHSRINQRYCARNPRGFEGYSAACWGLTASDTVAGYSAHSPTNDLGVISPTAALSSLPYTPAESMAAMRHFHEVLGDRLFGSHGFRDAFSIEDGWFAASYLAIDQGPIVAMIENHRSGLLWRLFMSCPEVESGLARLGFRRVAGEDFR